MARSSSKKIDDLALGLMTVVEMLKDKFGAVNILEPEESQVLELIMGQCESCISPETRKILQQQPETMAPSMQESQGG